MAKGQQIQILDLIDDNTTRHNDVQELKALARTNLKSWEDRVKTRAVVSLVRRWIDAVVPGAVGWGFKIGRIRFREFPKWFLVSLK
ncbi:hypothetical protein J5N97_020822 [Dioscorea zingiberensis]|uniref:Uncharacterized protein n=1 Tax=Dioscorea zingiberensis TaxID=325984 RepID=A0A9D5CHY8_9LILI|nr:hypothetical protein J5N97_020822 [Dioscorea zingiberensis]